VKLIASINLLTLYGNRGLEVPAHPDYKISIESNCYDYPASGTSV
jgi:hypothetical protein